MTDIDIQHAISENKYLREGMDEFAELEKTANDVAEEISSKLVETIVKDGSKYNITAAILTVAKCMSHLSSYLYDTEEEFLSDVKKAREAVPSVIIPSLLDPQPCGVCEECKNGNPTECLNPNIRGDRTTSRFLPILCNMIIEYDLFNKICYMHAKSDTEVKNEDKHDEAFAADSKKEESEEKENATDNE